MLKYRVFDNQKKEWVVFVHGINGGTGIWYRQRKPFSKDYNVLLLDLPGHGMSSGSKVDEIDVPRLTNAIKETMDHLNIEHAKFVGLSLGTLVIAHFMTEYPEYVDEVVFVGSVLWTTGFKKMLIRAVDIVKRIVPFVPAYKLIVHTLLPSRKQKKVRQYFYNEATNIHKETFLAWIGYVADHVNSRKMLRKLEELNQKIFFVSGENDHFFLKGVKFTVSVLKNTKMHIINNTGHVCIMDGYREFNEKAIEFLLECDREKEMEN